MHCPATSVGALQLQAHSNNALASISPSSLYVCVFTALFISMLQYEGGHIHHA